MSKLEEIKQQRLPEIKAALAKYGINGTTEVVYNPTYDELFNEETQTSLEGYEKGKVTELGAVDVMTGVYTGRSPKDKFIVMDENSKDTVWWTTEGYKKRQQARKPRSLEGCQRTRCQRTRSQEALRCRWLLRRKQRHPYGCALHHGSSMASSLRNQYVHPPHR